MLSHFSRVRLCATPWTVGHQAPLLMGFSREEYWSGLPCPPPGDLPDPEIKSVSLASPGLAHGFFTTSATWDAPSTCLNSVQFSHSVVSDSLWRHGLEPTWLLCPWDSLGKNTGVGCHFLLQGIFPIQRLNLSLLHCRKIQILYSLSHQGNTFLGSLSKC